MRHAKTCFLATWAAALLLASPIAAQDDLSDKERRDAARAEQRRAREEASRTEQEAARAAEAEAERARLAELGASEETLLEGERGFFVALDAFLGEPGGAERSVARVGDIVTSATTAEELDTDGNGVPDAYSMQNERDLRLAYDGELTPQLEIGWRRGTGAVFSLRYWAHSSDARASASSTLELPAAAGGPGLILGGIDNQGFENVPGAADADPSAFSRPLGSPGLPVGSFLHGADSVSATGSLEASRFDILYTHVGVARPRIELIYRVGLSLVQAERTEAATYSWRSYSAGGVAGNALSVESVATKADTQAFGLLVGIAGRFGLSQDRRWTLRGGLELSGLTNEQDLAFSDSWVTTQDGLDPLTVVAQNTTSTPAKSLLTTIDADLAVEARLGQHGRVGLGYRHVSWVEALSEQRFPDAANQALLVTSDVDLDFAGPYVRLSWFF